MNALQAASTLPGLSVDLVFDATPDGLPSGPYAVVSELADGNPRTYHREASGRTPRERTITTLITLYGAPEAPLADLRATYRATQELADVLTRTLDGRPIAGLTCGPDLPVRRDPTTKRPYAGVRFILKFRTGV